MYLFRQKGRHHWHIRWDQGGERHEVSTGTDDRLQAERIRLALREARERAVDSRRVDALLRSVYPEHRSRTVPMDQALEIYQAAAGDSPRTRTVASHWRQFAAWCLAKRPGVTALQDVDVAVCRAYAAGQQGAPPKTVANRVRDCARLWRVVAPEAGIALDPWKGVRLSVAAARPARALTQLEFDALLAATAGTEYAGAILVGWYTGLRYRDCAHLHWASVMDGALEIRPHKTAAHGIEVRIPLHARLAAYLEGLPRRGEWVFPELQESYGRRGTARRFAQACRAAGVSHTGITFHSLRHAFVTRLAEAGVPEDVRRRLAGHSSAATHDRYAHDSVAQREAISRLS